MMEWLAQNIWTILISMLLLAIVAGSIAVIRRDKRKGKSACGGNCSHCPMGCSCHHDK